MYICLTLFNLIRTLINSFMDGNWRDLFYFNRRERNGIFVLSTLIVLLLTFQYMMPYVVEENLAVADTSHLDAYLLQLQKDSMQYNKSKKRYSVVTYKNKEPELSLIHI